MHSQRAALGLAGSVSVAWLVIAASACRADVPTVAEECRAASAAGQLFVTTHSPFFVDPLSPAEVRVVHRTADGFTRVDRVADMPRVQAFLDEGATLGQLWMENQFEVGDPLSPPDGRGR